MALLVDPTNPTNADNYSEDVKAAAHTFGLHLHVLNASTESDFDEVFANLVQLRAGGLVVAADLIFHQPA